MPYFNEGEYIVKVIDQGFDESKEKRTPYFWLSFQPEDSCEYIRTVELYLTKSTIDRKLEQLRNLGWSGSSFSELEPEGGFSFRGTEMTVVCRHDGKYERWELPGGGGESRPLESKAGIARKMDALFGSALSPANRKAAKEADRPATAAIEEGREIASADDIPF